MKVVIKQKAKQIFTYIIDHLSRKLQIKNRISSKEISAIVQVKFDKNFWYLFLDYWTYWWKCYFVTLFPIQFYDQSTKNWSKMCFIYIFKIP